MDQASVQVPQYIKTITRLVIYHPCVSWSTLIRLPQLILFLPRLRIPARRRILLISGLARIRDAKRDA